MTNQLAITLKTVSGKSRSGQIILRSFSRNERLRRSLLTLLGFWGLSALSILIPIAHFVLVPAFFLLAPFLARQKWQQDASIIDGECLCPECSEKIPLGSLKIKWPLTLACLNCKSKVYGHPGVPLRS